MVHRNDDPTDYARTARPRMGEAMKDNRSLGGYLVMGLAVVAIAVCIGAAAGGIEALTIAAGVVAVLAAAAGSVWVYLERRRVGRMVRTSDRLD